MDRQKFIEKEGILLYKEDWVENDQRTWLVIRHIANTIHPMIQMEEDFLSNHQDGKLLILNLKRWTDRDG